MNSPAASGVILVTGGAGYIGAHACKALSMQGYRVVVFDNLEYGHKDFVKWGELVEGDLNSPQALKALLEKYRPDAVMHFAAYAYVGESVEEPSKYYHNNVVGTLNLLDALRDFDVRNFVFSSTCATYGVPESVPISEAHPQNPINPYGETKLIIERMLRDFDTAYAIKSVSLRYFNAAGADPDCEVGEDHTPETHLIPLALDAAAGLRPEITLFGTDYDTPDGSCIRDYIHVMDLADAHLRALKYLLDGGETAVFNLGNGSGYSVREVIESVERVTGNKVPVVEGTRRPGDPPSLVGSSVKAGELLGWNPLYADIDTIIEHAWRWHQKRFGG
ncbi:MAG: UDP-glucose 4-epimerase GalE [Proteobacteria bacterium]|nr:UDP-glucose 4-epimerase GalE [Pseudomonadota bacterium]